MKQCLQTHTLHLQAGEGRKVASKSLKEIFSSFFPWNSITSWTLLDDLHCCLGWFCKKRHVFVYAFVFLWHLLLLCYTEEEAVIVSGLKNTDVFVGESATFTCELSHPGVKNVQWWLDGSPLHNNFVTEISQQDGMIHTLTLNDVACHDSGTVTFRAGSLISSAKLLVKGISLLERNTRPPLDLLSVLALLPSRLPLLNVFTGLLCPAALHFCKSPVLVPEVL